jgi:Protein of unknown function, DUF547
MVHIGISMALGLLSLISVATSMPARGSETMSIREWESLWTTVLARHVDQQGRIDFAALKQEHRDLDRVIGFIADPAAQSKRFPDKRTRLAFYTNAYNALAMYGVVDAGIPKSLGGLTKFTFFYLRTFTIGGKSISLYDFENDVIRPLGEERVHFALNCMVVSCPRLPARRSARTCLTGSSMLQRARSSARAAMFVSILPSARFGSRQSSTSTPKIFWLMRRA